MDKIGLLRELQGTQTLDAFAARLGIARSTVSMILAGERVPGRRVIEGLVAAYPERREDILAVFFVPSDGQDNDMPVPVVTQEAAP